MISRVCEEFHCLPSQAIEEMEAAPLNLVFDIIALRAYAETKHRIDTAKSDSDLPRSALVDTVIEIQAEIIEENRNKRDRPERNPKSH